MTTSTNMAQAMAKASQNAKQDNAVQKRDQEAARTRKPAQQAPADDFAAKLAQMEAMMKQLAETNAELMAQNTALKAGKPAPKAEKSPVTSSRNVEWKYDEKAGKLMLVLDLNADIIDPETGAPKLSKSQETTGVCQFQANFTDKNGRKVGIGLNAWHKLTGK